MRFGVVLQGVDSPAEFGELVDLIDEAGFDDLWLTDSSLHARDPYVYLTLAAGRSTRLRLGTAVTNPLTRHPAITASTAATMADVAAGRFVLGIGAGDRPLHELGLRPARLAELESAIDAIRRLLAGETVRHSDKFTVDGGLRCASSHRIPVFMSASGPRTLALAGRIADGVILLAGLHPACVRFALDHIERGASEAGRARPHVAVVAYGAIDEDERRALTAAAPIAAWFPQTAPVYCELAGLDPAIVRRVRATYAGGEFQEATAAGELIPADFVRRMALAGGREHASTHLRNLIDVGVDAVHVFPLGPNRTGTIRAFAECWHAVTA
ncbi:LLM class flavin-dependent oxidoreductase [Actinophytocola sp.]|uniref:LLM class flavin-dependent oxidoreductase n=1 Tax=Actinophytocola sp. TaxID=1872138 RepID=UPI003D6B5C85